MCFEKRLADQQKDQPSEGMPAACITYVDQVGQDKNFWIADSGSSTHLMGFNYPLINIRTTDVQVSRGDGSTHAVKHVGDLQGTFVGGDGQRHQFTITDVHYAPSIKFSLFSIKRALKRGFSLGSKGETMFLTKGPNTFGCQTIQPSTFVAFT